MKSFDPILKGRLLEVASFVCAIALGPVFLFLGHLDGLMFAAAAYAFFLVCITIVPLIVVIGGRFKVLVWQLAALSLAVSVVVDDRLTGREAREVGFGIWVFTTILSSPLMIWLLVEYIRSRRQQKTPALASFVHQFGPVADDPPPPL